MKALSILQPWAWLIVEGYKDVENRTWKTGFRGKFLIHAPQVVDDYGFHLAAQLGIVPFYRTPGKLGFFDVDYWISGKNEQDEN